MTPALSAKELLGSAVLLLAALALAAGSLFIPVAPETRAEPESPFRVKENSISIPQVALKRIGLDGIEVKVRDEPVIARFTARTGFNMDRLTHVKTQFPGKIADIGPALGSEVRGPGSPGDPTLLCVVESVDLGNAKNAYQKAVVQLDLDEKALDRTLKMIRENVLGPAMEIAARTQVKKDQADVEAARQNLFVFGLNEKDLVVIRNQIGQERMVYQIYSPLSGIIAEKNVTRGEFADNTVNLFTIAETSTFWVWGEVYEKDWRKVAVGQKMKVVLAAYPEVTLESHVDFVSPTIDATTRSIRMRGTLENRDRKILSDMYGTLLVTVDEGAGSVIIPAVSVVRALKQDQSYVFVRRGVAGDGRTTFERIPVWAEAVDLDQLRVTKGLRAGDWVVTHGALNLFEEMSH